MYCIIKVTLINTVNFYCGVCLCITNMLQYVYDGKVFYMDQ